MARSERPARRVNLENDRVNYYKGYSRGNKAEKSVKSSEIQARKQKQRKIQEKNRQMQKERVQSRQLGPGYVIFLAIICCVTIILCVQYLRLRSTVTTQIETIAARESELSTLRAENDAYYNQAMASVALDDVRDAALNRLGLHAANEDQIQYYSTDEGSYVRQYQNVPE